MIKCIKKKERFSITDLSRLLEMKLKKLEIENDEL